MSRNASFISIANLHFQYLHFITIILPFQFLNFTVIVYAIIYRLRIFMQI